MLLHLEYTISGHEKGYIEVIFLELMLISFTNDAQQFPYKYIRLLPAPMKYMYTSPRT